MRLSNRNHSVPHKYYLGYNIIVNKDSTKKVSFHKKKFNKIKKTYTRYGRFFGKQGKLKYPETAFEAD